MFEIPAHSLNRGLDHAPDGDRDHDACRAAGQDGPQILRDPVLPRVHDRRSQHRSDQRDQHSEDRFGVGQCL